METGVTIVNGLDVRHFAVEVASLEQEHATILLLLLEERTVWVTLRNLENATLIHVQVDN